MRRSFLYVTVLILSEAAYPLSPADTPTVVNAAVPFYPWLARVANVQGGVVAEVVTSGGTFANIAILSGHPLFREAVTMNLRTWTLVNAPTTTFKVTYHYKISETCEGKPSVTLNLPTNVSICSPPAPPMIN